MGAEVRSRFPKTSLFSAWNTFSLEFLITLTDTRLTYEKTDVILLHLIQTNLQEHLNWSDATEGNDLYLSMIRLLNQFT